MRFLKTLSIGLMIITASLVAIAASPGRADATSGYAGNSRGPAYGVKADIGTPARQPTVTYGVVFDYVSNLEVHTGYNCWLQTGWVQGNGTIKAPNLVTWPSQPTSY